MNWKQFLTEKALKECWHSSETWYDCDNAKHCRRRTFDNRNDLMDLYQKVYEDGKWDEFFWFSASHCKPKREGLGCSEITAWLFCLDQKDYEYRCKMVAEFYGWKEKV